MSELNARDRIKQEISQLADGLKSRRPLAQDLRDLDALLADMALFAERIPGTFLEPERRKLIERAKSLGYSNDA